MCDICSDVAELLQKYENEIKRGEQRYLYRQEMNIVCVYVQAWMQRQCTCCFKDPKNFDKFNAVVQGLALSVIEILRQISREVRDANAKLLQKGNSEGSDSQGDANSKENGESKDSHSEEKNRLLPPAQKVVEAPDGRKSEDWSTWAIEEKEKILNFFSKVFLLNFPLYMAFKHSVHSKLEDMDIPVYLLRNVCFFCEKGGLKIFISCFQDSKPETLPMTLAHAMISIISNLKLWMNIGSIMQHLVPLRSCIIKYLCQFQDSHLRAVGNRNMFEYMWTAVKDPLDAHATFDREGLELAFKYFSSSTLTMRLAGISQINSHINMYNELCHNESLVEAESVGNSLANWLIENKIIECIFGPNLHVELIKQSHIILNFLAMEGRITSSHIDAVWSAAQLKHCSRQVLDLLPPLIKNLEVAPVMHLYKLLCSMETKEQTEQTLLLASALIKFIWSNGSSAVNIPTSSEIGDHCSSHSPFSALVKGTLPITDFGKGLAGKRDGSSSERSVSVDASNSEDEPSDIHHVHAASELDSSHVSDHQRSSGEASEHTAESPSSSPCTVRCHKSLVKHASHKHSAMPCHRGKKQWLVCRGHVRKHTAFVSSKCEDSSTGEESELSSVTDDSLHSDTDIAEGSEEMPPAIVVDKSQLSERSEDSGREESKVWKGGIIRRKRQRLACCKKRCIKRQKHVQACNVEVLSEESVENVNVPSENLKTDPSKKEEIKTICPDKESDVLEKTSSSPKMMPDLVKVVMGRDGTTPHFPEGLESDMYECRQYLSNLHNPRHLSGGSGEMVEDILSPDDGSCNSSQVSNKSDKNFVDFDGEESGCEDELAQLAAHAQAQLSSHPITQRLGTMACMYPQPRLQGSKRLHHFRHRANTELSEEFSRFSLDSVCEPGQTLIWDLLQDDKIGQLSEELAVEAEKILCNLVCWSMDKMIRMKFIEGCLQNIASNRSVLVSMRLLPKLFASFQQFRGGSDTHSVTLWAEKEHKMMKHFFSNLVNFVSNPPDKTGRYSQKDEIQVRLHFLTCIYSTTGSPENFCLSLDQLDILWQCLTKKEDYADELFSWLLNQAKSKDHHALSLNLFKHILLEKMPLLPAEATSMTALNLLQQLSSIAHLATASYDTPSSAADVSGMRQLWGIALRALNTDVSMAAVQYLNNYYINVHHGTLEKEDEFIEHCMESLLKASHDSTQTEVHNLMIIQRALLLLKTHIEAFSRRYAYHLRRWLLNGEGVSSHRSSIGEKQSPTIRIICQPAGLSEKITIELHGTDTVADLRAEVIHWWEKLQAKHKKDLERLSQTPSGCSNSNVCPLLGTLLSDGPIRMISQGQELTTDLDEKSLSEMGMKDMQLVFVSVGAQRQSRRREGLEPASTLPPPPRDRLPIILLLQPPYFEQLFNLMQHLCTFKTTCANGDIVPHTKAQVLSRRVWEILMMLPTSPVMLQGFKDIAKKPQSEAINVSKSLQALLRPETPQKLMYSLQIIESLRRNYVDEKNESDIFMGKKENFSWSAKFIEHGGLHNLFDIFMSQTLWPQEGEVWNEWNQDCTACLLKLIYQFSIEGSVENFISDDLMFNKKGKSSKKSMVDKLLVPKLNKTMLDMMSDVKSVLHILFSALLEAALPCDPTQCKTGFWGRGQVVSWTMTLLVSWAFSEPKVKVFLFKHSDLDDLLQKLVLNDPETSLRHEACTGLYRLCLGSTSDGHTGQGFILPLLNRLLNFLSIAQDIKPPKNDEEDKEPFGPGCDDYFWLVCQLVDNVDDDVLYRISVDQMPLLNLENLSQYLAESIIRRDFYEMRHSNIKDDGLRGLLSLMTVVMKHNPSFKCSEKGKEFLLHIFESLFALPSQKHRHLPKCKSSPVRSAAFDLLVELVKSCEENYRLLHGKLVEQHIPDPHNPYPWDYWPHEDGRAECGYVGLTNLGATCYLASCMQHLYMMPEARSSILSAKISKDGKHESTLKELQRMFAYLLESERKSYNPRSFCKVYHMDHQPLNTGEQKDMAEFFTNLISKLEEMTPELKELVKTLFCGILSNNVVSLDCPHISRNLEEFYTLRCQVADMRNLYESLDELTVKDTLEGDNMYTCSQCGKKVRAEKRACIKKLPKILCFNTMRYTFNMVTMTKEKVNTHFSFPMKLDMSSYMEKYLIPKQGGEGPLAATISESGNGTNEDKDKDGNEDCFDYELIGVTVHTGTADGGHYYSFIKERHNLGKDKWFFFNDAEVKPFDPSHLAAECFGGEMTSKTYDSVTDKFMDFSFEKTNSAYMLFYERIGPLKAKVPDSEPKIIDLTPELAEWIWQDNMQFLRDKSLFEPTYFNFMWQICSFIPHTLGERNEITLLSAKLATSFVLEILVHAKEKVSPTILQWNDLLIKQFNCSQKACEWFLDHMAENSWWPVQILIKCPTQSVRQTFQKLCNHVINQLKPLHSGMYLQPVSDGSTCCSEDSLDTDITHLGQNSCVTKFVKKLLNLIEHGAKQHLKHLTEYFTFLLDFARMGEEECRFLLSIETISTVVNFYLGQKASDYVDVVSDDEEDEDEETVDKYKPASLEKMITLIALLVEKSRNDDRLHLSHNDLNAITNGKGYPVEDSNNPGEIGSDSGHKNCNSNLSQSSPDNCGSKGFPFIYQQIRDGINLRQTCNLIFSLCRWNEHLAVMIVNMIFSTITKQQETSGPFFKLLSMLVEIVGGPPGHAQFTNLILQRIWDAAEYCPQQCLEWMTLQVPRNKVAHSWVLQSMENWVERFLIAHNVQRVRNVVALLLVSLVPSNNFRQAYRTARSMLMPQKEIPMGHEALMVMHQIYGLLLRLLKKAKLYVDPTVHGTTKLTSYFALMTYCLISRTEKLMFSPFFLDLWNLFQPKLSEPAIPVHLNKQALLIFWYQVCVECPENVKLIIQNSHVTKNIAFNYILADHDDQEVVMFNRCMLPAYYGLLRLCCQQSRPFTRQLASHQNIQWAFKNITPYSTQYAAAISELFRLMRLFASKYSDSTESELREVHQFKRTTLRLYLSVLDARACWATLINVLRTLVETTEDRVFVIYNNGLSMLFQAFITLHMMYHEATACHVTADMVELLVIVQDLLKSARSCQDNSELQQWLHSWKDHSDVIRKLLTLLNSFAAQELRQVCIEVLQELIFLYPRESLSTLVPILASSHATFQENNNPGTPGPFFPRRGQGLLPSKSSIRPPRPVLQMFLHASQLECTKGVDEEYDRRLLDFFLPYHQLVDTMCRVATSSDNVTADLVSLSAMLAIEGIPLHIPLFPKLWLDVLNSNVGRNFIQLLCSSNYFIDYMESVLLDERACLNHQAVYQLFSMLLPKVASQVINEQLLSLVSSLMSALIKTLNEVNISKQAAKLNGDLCALSLVFSIERPSEVPSEFLSGMKTLMNNCRELSKSEVGGSGEFCSSSSNCKDSRRASSKDEEKIDSVSSTSSSNEAQAVKRRRLSSSLGHCSSNSVPKKKDQPPGSSFSAPPTQSRQWAEILASTASILLATLQGNS